MTKKIFTQQLEGTRRRGRPRQRWKEEVERDLQVLGVRRWRELVVDRKKWKDIFRKAKAHSGLQCQWKKKENNNNNNNLDHSGSRSEKPGKFRNVVLEKDGEDQLDRSCEK